jgi:polar amino acid transport system substrate-binding protein
MHALFCLYHKRYHLIFVILLAFVYSGIVLFADSGPSQPLVVGMELNYPPFEMMDKNGNPAGLSVDMATALGEFLHRPVQVVNMPFEGLIPALKTKRVDLVISSMTITPLRAQSIDFSDPYCRSGLALLLKNGSGYNNIADLDKSGAVVVVKIGTTGDLYARDHLQNATILREQQATACALEVVEGRADAFIYDQMSVYKFHEKNPASRMNLKSFQEEPWGIGLAKGNDELKQQVNSFLADFRAKGGFGQLRDKYFAKEVKEFNDLNLPFYF